MAIGKKRLRELQHAAIVTQVIAEADGDGAAPFNGDAVELFQSIYRDHKQPLEVRIVAARAAVGFERPALSAVATKDVTAAVKSLEDLLLEKARLAAERGVSLSTKPAIEGRINGETDNLSVGR